MLKAITLKYRKILLLGKRRFLWRNVTISTDRIGWALQFFAHSRPLNSSRKPFNFSPMGQNFSGLVIIVSSNLSDAAYLHHWLSVTIHFNRYNLCFYKYTECRDKCKSLYFIVLHIRVVPPSFSHFVECPLSDTTCWTIGYSHMDVTERLLNTKVVILLGFLWFVVEFLRSDYLGYSIRWKKCSKTELFAWKSVYMP